MGPAIQMAVNAGLTATQILSFLSKKFKNLQSSVDSAKSSGYSDEEIIKFLSGKIAPRNQSKQSKAPGGAVDRALYSSGLKTKEEREQQRNKYLGGALAAGATGLSLYQMYRGLNPSSVYPTEILNPEVEQETLSLPNYQNQLPPPEQPLLLGNLPPSPQPQQNQTGIMGSPLPGPSGNISIAPVAETPQELSEEDALKHLSSSRFFNNFKTLSSSNPPEAISSFLRNTLLPKKEISEIEKRAGFPLEEIVSKAHQGLKKQTPIQERKTPASETKQSPTSIPKIARESFSITPEGKLLTVEDIKGKVARVKEGDKTRLIKKDKLEHPEQDVIQAVNDILQIPEPERSSVFALTQYSPTKKLLTVLFHNGKAVEYDDITPEEALQISQEGSVAKTSGGNEYGVHYEGEKGSRGAAFDQIIKRNPKYSVGNKDKTWRYVEVPYDYYKRLRRSPKKRKKEIE